MASQLNRCGRAIKFTLIVGNLLFLLLGLTLTALGAFLVHEFVKTVEFDNGDPRFIGCIIMSLCGVFTIQVSIIGVVGAAMELWPVLTLFIVCLSLATALNCSLGIFVIIPNLSKVDVDLVSDIQSYRMTEDPEYDESVNTIVDYIQSTFKCCGCNGPSDWITDNLEYCVQNEGLPVQCECKSDHSSKCTTIQIPMTDTNFTAWKKGCQPILSSFVQQSSLGIAGLAFMCLIQVLGISFSCCMCNCLFRKLRRRQKLHESIEVHTHQTYGSTRCEQIETQH